MSSTLDSGSNGQGSSPGQDHCVVFLGKTLYSHSTSVHPGVKIGKCEYAEASHPGRVEILLHV